MPDSVNMDSHKLIYHPETVAAWRQGERIYPIEVEIGLSGACNHRCIFCAVDYMGYETKFLDAELVVSQLREMSAKGLKSVIYSGEGEPLLNKDASLIIRRTKEFGVDAALATNGVFMDRDFLEDCLASLSWVRCSIAGATDATYEKIHRCRAKDLQAVFHNLQAAVAVKRDKKLRTTLGAQLLLLEDNKREAVELAKILREIGFDYLTVKPYSQHPQSKVNMQVDYSESREIERELKSIETEDFHIYFRRNSIENLSKEKMYDRCYGLEFMTHIDAGGSVYPCVAYIGAEGFCYGNLYRQSFTEIWESERTRRMMKAMSGDLLKKRCRKACRLDEMNKYLHELKNLNPHVNFI